MSYLQELKPGYFYIVQKVKGKRIVLWRATEAEIDAYSQARKQIKDMAFITCANPECDKQIAIPRSQKRTLNTTYPLRYGRFNLVYCSKECQQAHSVALRKLN